MRRRRSAFTLLEVLLSLALAALLLVAMNSFLFSMGELWGQGADRRLFDEHVNAVGRFLSRELQAATVPPAARANATPVIPQQITPAGSASANLITFDLPAGCRILPWPDRPLPEVVCSLQVREHQGLYLLWQSRLETTFGTNPPRELLLTPLASALSYDYFDTNFNRWNTQTDFINGTNNQPEAPQRLRITFTYGKLKRDVVIPIPQALQGVPDF